MKSHSVRIAPVVAKNHSGVQLFIDDVQIKNVRKLSIDYAANESPILRVEIMAADLHGWQFDEGVHVIADVVRFDVDRESIARDFMREIGALFAKYTARLFDR